MMRFSIARCLSVLTLLTLGACSKENEPPPPYNTVLSQGSQELPPVPLVRPDGEGLPPASSARYLKKIGGPAGNPSEVSLDKAGAKPAEAAKAIALNDAEAEPLFKQFVELGNTGNFEATIPMFVPDQQPILQKLAPPTTAVVKNLARLRTALKDAPPEILKQLQPDAKGAILIRTDDGAEIPVMVPQLGAEVAGVTPQGSNKASATLRQGAQGPEEKYELEQVDGKWRIRQPNLPPSPEQVAPVVAMLNAVGKAFGEVADKVEQNTVQPPDVMKELGAALKRAIEEAKNAKPETADAAGQEPQPTSPDNAAQAPKPDNNPAPKKTSKRRPDESASGRNVNSDLPTVEETLGRQ